MNVTTPATALADAGLARIAAGQAAVDAASGLTESYGSIRAALSEALGDTQITTTCYKTDVTPHGHEYLKLLRVDTAALDAGARGHALGQAIESVRQLSDDATQFADISGDPTLRRLTRNIHGVAVSLEDSVSTIRKGRVEKYNEPYLSDGRWFASIDSPELPQLPTHNPYHEHAGLASVPMQQGIDRTVRDARTLQRLGADLGERSALLDDVRAVHASAAQRIGDAPSGPAGLAARTEIRLDVARSLLARADELAASAAPAAITESATSAKEIVVDPVILDRYGSGALFAAEQARALVDDAAAEIGRTSSAPGELAALHDSLTGLSSRMASVINVPKHGWVSTSVAARLTDAGLGTFTINNNRLPQALVGANGQLEETFRGLFGAGFTGSKVRPEQLEPASSSMRRLAGRSETATSAIKDLDTLLDQARAAAGTEISNSSIAAAGTPATNTRSTLRTRYGSPEELRAALAAVTG